MTIIAAIADSAGVWMGGDSAAVGDGYEISISSDPKVFGLRAGDDTVGIGAAGSYRFGQIVAYELELDPVGRTSATRWMNTAFTSALQDALKGNRHDDIRDGVLLVTLRGRLYEVYADRAVVEISGGYGAVGCGGPFALGALTATKPYLDPEERLRVAMKAAAKHSSGVRAPFMVRFFER